MRSSLDRILVTGVTGQMGRATLQLLGAHHCIAASRAVLPLDFPEAIENRLDYLRPRAILNAGAYTAVDLAESADQEITVKAVNEESPARLSRWCARNGVPLVHFSTDYVFDGTGSEPRAESAPTAPLNAYGASKLAGEQAILASGCRALIFRTSWVYDHQGKNFFRTMLRLGAEREQLRVVNDQVGAPTFAPQLADASLHALDRALEIEQKTGSFPTGIYHLCNTGATSRHGFAQAIFEAARQAGVPLRVRDVQGITTSDYPTPAQRPLNSRLCCDKAEEILGVRLPDWKRGLEECLDLWREQNHPGESLK